MKTFSTCILFFFGQKIHYSFYENILNKLKRTRFPYLTIMKGRYSIKLYNVTVKTLHL